MTAPESDEKPLEFIDVFEAELGHIEERRRQNGAGPKESRVGLCGLALSGGGIRSATFCLGVLQRLASRRLLKKFDYLSTVSGGGYVGGWWSAWLSRQKASTPSLFPPDEGIELPDRPGARRSAAAAAATKEPDSAEGSRHAGSDPIHHLRLFANYLVPKKGALSGDTWRAILVVSRNLLLTLLMLMPLLAAVVLLPQVYYTANAENVRDFLCRDSRYALLPVPAPANGDAVSRAGRTACQIPPDTVLADRGLFRPRGVSFLIPPIALSVLLGIAILFWMIFSTGKFVIPLAIFTLVGAMVYLLLEPSSPVGGQSSSGVDTTQWFWPLMSGLVVFLILAGASFYRSRSFAGSAFSLKDGNTSPSLRAEILTNFMSRLQTALLVAIVVVTLVLLISGFGYDAARYLYYESKGGSIARAVASAGGILAVAGAVFTGIKAGPTGGADSTGERPGWKTRLTFAITPYLVLIALVLGLCVLTHAILRNLTAADASEFPNLYQAFFIGLGVCIVFATFEFIHDVDPRNKLGRIAVVTIALMVAVAAFFVPIPASRVTMGPVIGAVLAVVLAPWLVHFLQQSDPSRIRWRFVATLALVVLFSAAGLWLGSMQEPALGDGHRQVARTALIFLGFATFFVFLSYVATTSHNRRPLALLSVVAILAALVLMQQYLIPSKPEVFVPSGIVAMVGILFSIVVGLGWLLDPNYLSLHTFYKARLVRAYLGASNHRGGAEITEAAAGDDILLKDLKNCELGAPYHLINTTLNLVGGRDLATAQRSSACFTMSQLHCGSSRTGYRKTGVRGKTGRSQLPAYMDGTLSLGTAVAVSGAAASPNMGAHTPNSALAMLLALLNVRLGFWAPSPHRAHWRSPRPRLWPFYLVREFLSQTTDLSSYCYLTDGGHFDNTGLYSLVQRGCRRIVVIDCGADPKACFADIGDAVRRCRIDFGATIELDVANFERGPEERFSKDHIVFGTIQYSERHFAALGWPSRYEPRLREGSIVWVKPSLLPKDPAEVRQYGLENGEFPHQTTGDQFFDEAQFESYRRLGETCGNLIPDTLRGSAK